MYTLSEGPGNGGGLGSFCPRRGGRLSSADLGADFFSPKVFVVEVGGDVDGVGGHVFAGDVVWQAAADIQAVALANGVKEGAVVLADFSAAWSMIGPWG